MRGFRLQEEFVTQVRCQNMKFAIYKTIGVHMGPANFLVPIFSYPHFSVRKLHNSKNPQIYTAFIVL